MTVELKRFSDTFSGNGNVVTLVARPRLNQTFHTQTETAFRIESETSLDKWNTTRMTALILVLKHKVHITITSKL